MAREIELPDGTIAEFPDDMGDDAIKSVLSKQFGQAPAPAAPKPFIESLGDEAVATGRMYARQGKLLGRNLLSAAASPFTLAGDAVGKVANSIGGAVGVSPLMLPSEGLQNILTQAGLPEPATGPERFTQSMAESAPAFALPATLGMQVLGNAAISGIQAKPGTEGRETLAGGALGAGGHALARTMTGLVKPTQQARVLMDRGVALTPGQAAGAGSSMKWLEEHASSLPVSSHFIRNAQRRAVGESNIAAAQAVTDIVAKDLKLGMPPREAIEGAREAVGKTYDYALEGLTAPSKALRDTFASKLESFPDDFPLVPLRDLRQMKNFVDTRLELLASRVQDGTLDGPTLKQLDSEIGQHIRNLRSSTNAADKTAAPAWSDLQQVLREAMEIGQKDPDKVKKLTAANTAYRQLLVLEKSLLPGAETFTSRRLAAQLDKAKPPIKEGPLRDVSNAMTATLPNEIPNSGTTERFLMTALPAALLGGGGYGATSDNPLISTLGVGAMAAGALGSRTGARALTGGYAGQQALSFRDAQMARYLAAMLRGQSGEK